MKVTHALLRGLLASSLLLFFVSANGQVLDSADAEPTKLVVGTLRVPPFVLRGDDGLWSGLSIDLWKQIAAELKIDFEFRDYDYDPAGLLEAVERRKVDAAVAAIPVTLEGESRFDFSLPYFSASLGVAVRTQQQRGLARAVVSAVAPQLLMAVGALLGVLLLVGTLMWLLERKADSSQFDAKPVRGIGDGIWWAAVTMTTTGYGDKVPISWRGRALGLVWMFTSIFIIALFSATLASAFVVKRLQASVNSPADLPRARIAVVSLAAGEQWLNSQNLNARSYPFVIQASKALQRGDVEALVHERAILGYMIKQYGWQELKLLPHTLATNDYAIALPADSPYREAINRALLKVIQRPQWRDVVRGYVGATDTDQPQ